MMKSILVVDDSRSLRQMVSLALRDAGYDVIEAGDGEEGIKKLFGQQIALIISDLYMPNVDGIEMIKRIRQLPSYRFTPIIMMSTEAGNNKKDEAMQAGAKLWMEKPLKPSAMLTTVTKLIN